MDERVSGQILSAPAAGRKPNGRPSETLRALRDQLHLGNISVLGTPLYTIVAGAIEAPYRVEHIRAWPQGAARGAT